MQVNLNPKSNLFLKLIEINLDLKLKKYLNFLTRNIRNAYKN